MNATYNPFRAAAEAVFAELSSRQFYVSKAFEAIDGAITVSTWAYQLAQMTYMMGGQCRQWCEELERNAQAPAQVLLLLMPAQEVPLTPQTDAGRKLLGKAIKSGLRLIEENRESAPTDLLLLPAASSDGKPKRQQRKRKTL
jgi:hypothetical protein